ncbi:MAG TPA: AbgT family transporter [Bacteroidales bacterium]|nr:AbgT family transporter [Bacteroidales bacterium]
MTLKKKKFNIPNTFTIVFFIIVVAAVLTWIIPSGEFMKEVKEVDGSLREVIVPDSYHLVEKEIQTWQIFSAFFNGFVKTANIIVFILMIGGAFWILNFTKAINIGILSFLKIIAALQKKRLFRHININTIVLVSIMIVFSLFGAIFGMSEETLAFVIIFVPLAISMGYDSIVGLSICYLAAHIGFAGGIFNPFTIGIAQGFAGIPLFSGFEYRFLCWLIFTFFVIVFILWYANKIKKNPEKSPTYKIDNYWREQHKPDELEKINYHSSPIAWILYAILSIGFIYLSIKIPLTEIKLNHQILTFPVFPITTVFFMLFGFVSLRKSVHFFILLLLFLTIWILIVGVLGYQWYIMEIATLFFVLGICAGIAFKCSADKIAKLFLEGCKDIMNAALIVGLAGGIIIILQDGKIIDTILYNISNGMQGLSKAETVGGMYLFQTVLNLIIPSGSAKAALTIPIMAQFADLLQVSRQSMVLAFQFGDGITNIFTPASGVLIGCLGIARIPYVIWVKWVYKFLLFLLVLGFFLLLPPLFLSINGF